MLQQTRVDTVIPYYERFIERWPTVADLARADPRDVQAAWSGLGYYRRARLMLNAAGALMRDHQAALPGDLAKLRALPGFGRYTAGAVGSIAFGLEAPAVDGNVMRVLARLYAVDGDTSIGRANAEVWRAAEALVPGEAPGELNQALIELGATVCGPRTPRCEACPVEVHCVGRAKGIEREIPPPRKRARRTTIETTALLLVDARGRVLLERQPPEGLFADLWCLPMLEGRLEPDAAIDEAARRYRFELIGVETLAEMKHVLTHRDILMRVISGTCVARAGGGQGRRPSQPELRWVMLEEIDQLGVPSMTVRALEASLPASLLARARLPRRGKKTRARERKHDAEPG